MAGREEWVEVQKTTFTRWANTYLSRKRMQIDDLYEDLKDGIRLIALLQIICREKVTRKFSKKPKMRIQKMENLNFVFAFLQKKNVNVTNIGSSDILDGNNKLVLGLMWTLIKSFQVAEVDVEGVSGKDGLLLWVSRSLVDIPNVNVKNFSSDWADGLAFCGLIHRYYPSLIPDFDKLSPSNAHANVKLAFDVAEQTFKIPQLLNVNDVAGKAKPDEKSIMTYVSLLFKEFASGVQKKKAVTTICKAVNIAQRHQDLAQDYDRLGSSLLQWLNEQTSKFESMTVPRRLEDSKVALARHLEHKKNDKPPREADFVALEGVAGLWISSCKNNNREIPKLDPPLEKLQDLKTRLDKLEADYETNLRKNLESFQKTEVFLIKTVKELEKMESWAKDKQNSVLFFKKESEEQGMTAPLIASSSAEAEEKLEFVAFVEEIEVPRYNQLLKVVVEHSKQLAEDHSDTLSTIARVEAMKTFMDTISVRVVEVKKELEEALKAQHEVDAIVKDCKTRMRSLKYVIEEMDEEIEVATNISTNSTKESVLIAQQHFEETLFPKVQETIVKPSEDLLAKKPALAAAGRTTDVASIEKVNSRVQNLLDSCNEKRGAFAQELKNVELRDLKAKEFAKLSALIKERCSRSTQMINAVEGTLADQFSSMVSLKRKLFRSDTLNSEDIDAAAAAPSATTSESDADGDDTESKVADDEDTESKVAHSDDTESKVAHGDDTESKVAKVEKVQEELTPLTLDMEELEVINSQLEQLQVFSNPYTTDTIHSLRATVSSLETAVREKVKSLEKEVALSELGSLTQQQIAEIAEVFNHFDLDKDKVLARDEFIMACKGMGLTLSEEDCHDYFDRLDADDNDEITFDEFSRFCAEQLQSGSSAEDVKAAFDILTAENLSMEKVEELFDPPLVEFIKENSQKLMKEDGKTLDFEKFSKFIFQ